MLYVILDNLRSALNVGAIFRTAEALGVEKLYLCGITPRPAETEVEARTRAARDLAKTALGAERYLSWEFQKRTSRVVARLREQGFLIVALEQATTAEPIFSFKPRKNQKLALIVGNEVKGLSPNLLKKCDKIIYIPMRGRKESLNVSVAFGIAGYWLRFQGGIKLKL